LERRFNALVWVHLVALLCASVATLLSFHARHTVPRAASVVSNAAKSADGQPALANSDSSESRLLSAGRPVYPYSVIPGGVENGQELKYAVFHDSVVANHYADFNLASARVVRLDRNRAVYVSYRLGDRVYWTKKTLNLLKGESLITDGVHEARTRCGNRVSDTPVGPVSPLEPSPRAMATPVVPELLAVNQPPGGPPGPPIAPPAAPPGSPGTPPGGPPTGGVIPPVYYPPVGGGPPGRHSTITPPPPPPPPPPVSTPEPGSFVLLAIGLLALLAANAFRSIRKKRKS
jgi:hypothetical protein